MTEAIGKELWVRGVTPMEDLKARQAVLGCWGDGKINPPREQDHVWFGVNYRLDCATNDAISLCSNLPHREELEDWRDKTIDCILDAAWRQRGRGADFAFCAEAPSQAHQSWYNSSALTRVNQTAPTRKA